VSSAPFRKTKKYTHEGGIATPLIAYWPNGIDPTQRGKLVSSPGHLIDLMPTMLELSKATFPAEWNKQKTLPPEGISLAGAFHGRAIERSAALCWEHEGHRAIRDGKWKLVASHDDPWELYDMESDRTELHNLAAEKRDVVQQLEQKYQEWARRIGVKPWPIPAKPAPGKK
jgi:arylsulfatase